MENFKVDIVFAEEKNEKGERKETRGRKKSNLTEEEKKERRKKIYNEKKEILKKRSLDYYYKNKDKILQKYRNKRQLSKVNEKEIKTKLESIINTITTNVIEVLSNEKKENKDLNVNIVLSKENGSKIVP